MKSSRSVECEELVERATRAGRERAEALAGIEDWGYRIDPDVGESFLGRWRGETTDAANGDRRVFLLWDADGERCYSRTYKSLAEEIDRVQPTVGCTIAISRLDDYKTVYTNPGRTYGVATRPCAEPLPETSQDEESASTPLGQDNELPF